jgi:hypothetical protein
VKKKIQGPRRRGFEQTARVADLGARAIHDRARAIGADKATGSPERAAAPDVFVRSYGIAAADERELDDTIRARAKHDRIDPVGTLVRGQHPAARGALPLIVQTSRAPNAVFSTEELTHRRDSAGLRKPVGGGESNARSSARWDKAVR